ncbi:TPA_asm: hypothetical protein HUJ06_032089 [Nelumbo nucifera]|uniref:Uncharacterized protein n=1 Tax=Nelumbo nucifera TaxID=4432 RepID=A0A822ZXP1_NELNU|nr:TPA_asm: hypothetical protein HUJ06_004600 [Nelumbo nucifera]DAD49647.1 TPA_asm: hypothetical protein HUJ06_032089 [Nelumbo nucifera]
MKHGYNDIELSCDRASGLLFLRLVLKNPEARASKALVVNGRFLVLCLLAFAICLLAFAICCSSVVAMLFEVCNTSDSSMCCLSDGMDDPLDLGHPGCLSPP